MAALEAEYLQSMEEATMVAKNLGWYRIMEGGQSPEAYAEFKMEHNGSVLPPPSMSVPPSAGCRTKAVSVFYLDWPGSCRKMGNDIWNPGPQGNGGRCVRMWQAGLGW